MKFNIFIEDQNNLHKLFLLGYTSDGGFFVKDFINTDNRRYLINKLLIPDPSLRRFKPRFNVLWDQGEYWATSKSPKLTHHVDGVVQVSGTGIVSGFYKFFKKHKGAYSQSMDLKKRNNDGGPIFIFHTRNLPSKIQSAKKAIIITPRDQVIDFYFGPPKDEHDRAFSLEFFYLPKEYTKFINLSSGSIPFKHPNYGIIPLKYIPSPPHSPGIIGIFTRVSSKGGEDKNFYFSLNGGAGMTLENGKFTNIIITPFIEGDDKILKVKQLDFNFFYKARNLIDLILYKIKKVINHTLGTG